MSIAWDTTSEDLANVLRLHSIQLAPDKLDEIVEKLDLEKIEEAALRGDDIDEQTNCAYEEIEEQLVKAGDIPVDVPRQWVVEC